MHTIFVKNIEWKHFILFVLSTSSVHLKLKTKECEALMVSDYCWFFHGKNNSCKNSIRKCEIQIRINKYGSQNIDHSMLIAYLISWWRSANQMSELHGLSTKDNILPSLIKPYGQSRPSFHLWHLDQLHFSFLLRPNSVSFSENSAWRRFDMDAAWW